MQPDEVVEWLPIMMFDYGFAIEGVELFVSGNVMMFSLCKIYLN